MKDLFKRALTGAIFVITLIGAILWNEYSVAILFLVVAILGIIEFFNLMEKSGFQPQRVTATLIGVLIYGSITLYSFGSEILRPELFALSLPLLILIVIVELFRNKPNPVSNLAFSILGVIYLFIPLSLINFFAYDSPFYTVMGLEESSYQFIFLLGYFVIQWASDTGAYLFGSMLGRTKLFERISPNKTWEGSIGGTALAVATGYLFSYFSDSNMVHWMAVAIIVSVFGTLGDLTESQIKRSCGVKDSGNLLPGHGGILDRFDGVLFSAPFVLSYLLLIKLYS